MAAGHWISLKFSCDNFAGLNQGNFAKAQLNEIRK